MTPPAKPTKRNCKNCRFLEWGHGDENDPQGWMCNGRGEYRNRAEESAHLARLESEQYRDKSKVCHEWPGNLETASGCI
jgi:hypothetical protein